MKEGAIYVNTARARLHDTDALVAALRRGHLGGAGLDHFVGEHLAVDHPLCSMGNVVLTPHIGGATYDTEANHSTLDRRRSVDPARRRPPPNLVNPEVLEVSEHRDGQRRRDQGSSCSGTAQEMLRSGLVEGTAGNVAARLPDGNVVLTPSSPRLPRR